MPAKVNLFVLGLTVVQKSNDDDIPHIVSSIEPPKFEEDDENHIPPHQTFLGIRAENIEFEGDVREPDIKLKYSTVLSGIKFLPLDPQTKIGLSVPTTAWPDDAPSSYDPMLIADLGLGRLKEDVGSGPWVEGEDSRLFLPHDKAHAGWGRWLGNFQLGDAAPPRQVADLFFWRAEYDDYCRIVVDGPTDRGAIRLKGQCEIRFLCADPEENETLEGQAKYKPFDFSHAFERLCVPTGNGGSVVRPIDLTQHPGSGSCPPIGGP